MRLQSGRSSYFLPFFQQRRGARLPRNCRRRSRHRPAAPTVVAEVLEQGRTLESQHRWPEAFALYGDAARKNPGQPELEQRLDVAKLHFDIGRRYNDATFRNSLTALSDADALETFTDTATKLNAHYVQNPGLGKAVCPRHGRSGNCPVGAGICEQQPAAGQAPIG